MSTTKAEPLASLQSFSAQERSELSRLLTPRLTKYIPWQPTETQAAFLVLDCGEALYGGAAGGGKSVALLMAALQYVDVPGYNALLLRRTFAALSKPGALIDLAHDWLQGTDATWNEQQKGGASPRARRCPSATSTPRATSTSTGRGVPVRRVGQADAVHRDAVQSTSSRAGAAPMR